MKLPFDFSLKFAFRLLLPGFVVSLGLLPLVQTVLEEFNVSFPSDAAFLLSVVLCGYMFVVLDMPIYMAFEGRRYWPGIFKRSLLFCERKRLQRLKKKHSKFEKSDHTKYLEASVELRHFPLDEVGEYTVVYPTRLGNLLNAYEDYPRLRYGMDAAFYWYRIWMIMDKDIRAEIDDRQAVADGTVYTSAALVLTGFLSGFYAIVKLARWEWIQYLPDWQLLMVVSPCVLLGGMILYRVSLHCHAQFGETFKAVFDLYHSKVDVDEVVNEIAGLVHDDSLKSASRRVKFKVAWRYLHNYRVKTLQGTVVPVPKLRGTAVAE